MDTVALDEYRETVVLTPAGPTYRYGDATRPFLAKKITLRYRTGPAGSPLAERDVTAYYVVGLTPAVNAEDDAHTLLLERGNCGVAGKDVTGTKWGWKEVGILGEVGSVIVDLGIRIDDTIIV